jgi:hypothetical protein
MVVTRRPRSDSSLERIMKLIFLKKNPLVKSGFAGFLDLEKVPSS